MLCTASHLRSPYFWLLKVLVEFCQMKCIACDKSAVNLFLSFYILNFCLNFVVNDLFVPLKKKEAKGPLDQKRSFFGDWGFAEVGRKGVRASFFLLGRFLQKRILSSRKGERMRAPETRHGTWDPRQAPIFTGGWAQLYFIILKNFTLEKTE